MRRSREEIGEENGSLRFHERVGSETIVSGICIGFVDDNCRYIWYSIATVRSGAQEWKYARGNFKKIVEDETKDVRVQNK